MLVSLETLKEDLHKLEQAQEEERNRKEDFITSPSVDVSSFDIEQNAQDMQQDKDINQVEFVETVVETNVDDVLETPVTTIIDDKQMDLEIDEQKTTEIINDVITEKEEIVDAIFIPEIIAADDQQLRKTLNFLQEEHLVKQENVDDLDEDGSQNTIFWYIDYNHAVKVIMVRMYLLQEKLKKDEIQARSCSMYHCPGFESKVCNGRYTESEAQQVVDTKAGLFLCQECARVHVNNPDPPPKESYTLQLEDNTKDLKNAEENLRRVKVQFSRKMIGTQQLRNGIYDLIEKVRSKGAGPLTSNLPSENREMDIGTERIEGTGRTYNIKQKKREQQKSKAQASGAATLNLKGGKNDVDDLTFLKNAIWDNS